MCVHYGANTCEHVRTHIALGMAELRRNVHILLWPSVIETMAIFARIYSIYQIPPGMFTCGLFGKYVLLSFLRN